MTWVSMATLSSHAAPWLNGDFLSPIHKNVRSDTNETTTLGSATPVRRAARKTKFEIGDGSREKEETPSSAIDLSVRNATWLNDDLLSPSYSIVKNTSMRSATDVSVRRQDLRGSNGEDRSIPRDLSVENANLIDEIYVEFERIEELHVKGHLGRNDVVGADKHRDPVEISLNELAVGDDVVVWLKRLSMEKYAPAFIAEGYDELWILAKICGQDLSNLGVSDNDAHGVLLPAIAELRGRLGTKDEEPSFQNIMDEMRNEVEQSKHAEEEAKSTANQAVSRLKEAQRELDVAREALESERERNESLKREMRRIVQAECEELRKRAEKAERRASELQETTRKLQKKATEDVLRAEQTCSESIIRMKEEHCQRLVAVKEECANQIQSTRESCQREIDTARRAAHTEITNVREQCNKRVEDARKRSFKDVAEVRTRLASELQQERERSARLIQKERDRSTRLLEETTVKLQQRVKSTREEWEVGENVLRGEISSMIAERDEQSLRSRQAEKKMEEEREAVREERELARLKEDKLKASLEKTERALEALTMKKTSFAENILKEEDGDRESTIVSSSVDGAQEYPADHNSTPNSHPRAEVDEPLKELSMSASSSSSSNDDMPGQVSISSKQFPTDRSMEDDDVYEKERREGTTGRRDTTMIARDLGLTEYDLELAAESPGL